VISDGTLARKIITENDAIETTNNLKDKTLRHKPRQSNLCSQQFYVLPSI
jgi:hypothetical protein